MMWHKDSSMKTNYAFTRFVLIYITFQCVTEGLANVHPFGITSDCNITLRNETFDLSPLRKWNPWNITLNKNGSLISYQISICDGLANQGVNDPCSGGSVCKISNGQRELVADSTRFSSFKSQNFDIKTLTINLNGPKCSSNSAINQSVIFFLSCGPHLGQPVLFTDSLCRTSFLWTTSVVCSSLSNQLSEVPCSTFDDVGRFYDLSPLINNQRNHLVETHDGSEFMAINVCSYLANDETTTKCPRNISSCIKKNGNFLPAGSLTEPLRLKRVGHGLQLTYQSMITIKNCTGPSKTVVDFICPSQGKGKTPELILSSDCLYNVYWETEFACPVSVLSVSTCEFKRNIHGVDIDLSPLRRKTPYNVSGIVNGEPVEFYFNVCAGLGDFECGNRTWRSGTVCAKSSFNRSGPEILYGNKEKLLKYISGEITLEYPGLVKCSEGQYWKNVIKFNCDSNAQQNGSGFPKFVGQEDCVNLFEWKTKYACIKSRSLECELKSGPLSIILNPIYRHHSEATWKAIDSLSPVGKSREIYLNLCDDRDLMGAPPPCPAGSSICIRENGTSVSLAGKTESPVISHKYLNGTHTYQIEFEHGDPCPNGLKRSKLILECEETLYASSAVLVSETPCNYEFRWKTYAACQHQRLKFDDCKFEDKERGITVDLNPLMSSTYYKIESNEYDFFINICGPVKETNCTKLGMSNARGCQVKKDTSQAWSLGEIAIGAAYDNGELINITYTGGTPYRDANRTPRSMSITLICDLDANKGSPVFNGEENRVYSFLWRTSLVCATEDTVEECVIYDSLNKKQYDLSRLSKPSAHEDWSLMDPNGKRKFYLNICRPLNKPNGCDKQSAACLAEIVDGKETDNKTNIGKAVNLPKVTSEGHLQLHYTMGDTCISFGKMTNYSVLINFICNSKALESQGPKYLGILGNCSYSFLWVTEAACPIGKEEFHECSYTDTDTGYHFDLNPLLKKDSFYEIKNANETFQFNICGPVGGNGCQTSDADNQISVCEIDKDGKAIRILGYAESGVISQFDGLPATITYMGFINGTFPTATDIEFECDHSSKNPQIIFQREETGVVYFRVTTSLVCAPTVFDCGFITDEGVEYDLSSLVRDGSSYWTVRDSEKDRVFHLSLCGAVTGVGGVVCHGAGICVGNDTNPHDGLSLGNRVGSPKVQDDSIIIIYKNGSPCENGLGNKSASIVLRCSTQEKPPVFLSEQEDCSYLFSMETPAACPIKTFIGNNCRVRDQVYNHVFDLTALINKTSNYLVAGEEHFYLLNVCGALSDPPLGCEGAAVCQTKASDKNFSISAGKPNSELIYNNGLIQLLYKGGRANCHKKYERSTIINFICDHSTEGLEGPHFLFEDHDCTYVFEWPSSWACPPFREKSCSVQGPDQRTYDLTPLSNPNNNYVIENPLNSEEKFVINVCRSVVHKLGSRCPYDASSCLVSTDSSKNFQKSKNLGTLGVVTNPAFENGILKIHYTNGDFCRLEGTFKHYMETSIEFRCDEMAMDSQPELLDFENCQYTFIWFTPYACPIKSLSEVGGNCSVTNPETGQLFDFSSLRDKEISVQSSPNHKFALSICQELRDSPCGKGIGSCQMEHSGERRSFSSGMANSNILWKDGILFLIYSDGSDCHSGHFKRSTVIRFICDEDRSLGESKVSFVNESSDCTYLFNWHTKLACENAAIQFNPDVKKTCQVQTKRGLIDLSPAMDEVHITHSSYQNFGIYFMSLCGEIKNTLLNIPKKASAACINCSPNDSVSLGHFLKPPYVNNDNVVQMDYINGSDCLKNLTRKMASSIFFVCDKKRGLSKFDVIDNSGDECLVFFEFRSPYACPIKPAVCSYGDEDKGFYLELAGFEKENNSFEVLNDKDKYIISICKPLNISNCTGAGVCLVNERGNQNFGLVKNSNVYHNTIHMTLTYDSDVNCSGSVTGKRHTEIKFYCDQSAGIGKPQFYKKYSCRLVFLWATAEVCSGNQPVCTLWTKDQKFYDLRVLSSISHSWNITDQDGSQYWLNMCREVNQEASSCPPFSSICIVPPNSTTGLSVGSVLTQKIAIDDATKEIVLSYDHGDESLCQTSTETTTQRQRVDKKASSEIRLKCGKISGFPKLVSKTNCEYKFVWETHIACPELENEPMYLNKGLIYDTRLQELGIVMNISSLLEKTYEVVETNRKDDFVYVINLGEGVGDNISDPVCQDALVCQTKKDRSFFRDIGTKGAKNFYLRGSEMKLIITSHGRKCGKNNSKNVTTIINFQCARTEGLGFPEFKYESGDCDYIFNWETSAVCTLHHIIHAAGNWNVFNDLESKDQSSEIATSNLSVSAIVAIIFAILIALILFGVLVKKERRNALKSKTRHFFQRMRFPRYQYMQCYFLRLRGENAHSRADGEAVLLSPDDPLPRFHDDSDVDPIA